MRIVVINHLTLDGVMQALVDPMRTPVAAFSHGGWATAGNGEVMVHTIGERMAKPVGGMLLGRRSYQDMLASWNSQGWPYEDGLNNACKYVASSNSATTLKWPKSTLVHRDIPDAVAKLKQNSGGNIVIVSNPRDSPCASISVTTPYM
jgi:dihydrofolate reductase